MLSLCYLHEKIELRPHDALLDGSDIVWWCYWYFRCGNDPAMILFGLTQMNWPRSRLSWLPEQLDSLESRFTGTRGAPKVLPPQPLQGRSQADRKSRGEAAFHPPAV